MTYTPPEGVTIGTVTAYALPATFRAPEGAGISYKIYGTAAGVGTATSEGEPAGYKILILNTSGNLWNGEIEQGAINTQGYKQDDNTRVRSCITGLVSGHSYTIQSNLCIRIIYAYNGGWSGTKIRNVYDSYEQVYECTFTLPEGADSIGISIYKYGSATTTPSDVTTAVLVDKSNYDLFIGDSKLLADEYVDYGEQKVYKMISGALTPTDPPAPLPAISTYKGENTISSTETLGDVEFTGEWSAIMGSTQSESIDIGFTVDADEYIAYATVDDGPSIQVSDTITMPSSADSFTLEVVAWGRERYTDTVYNALS